MMRSKIRQDRLSLSTGAPPKAVGAASPVRQEPQKVFSGSLFQGGRELHIHHNEEVYRLTITKLGKLILTK
ncbi:hemin uptake protein HemP [Roseibium aquae]|uniref:hemin uptake protein HemP n=1 Tax=Roseibium aquae TaxID=1323746 RepID=UPI001AD90D4F|nr:hemin uptake protein HemP [Roseibium aquae]